ncbi:MAG: lipoyl synthase [Actinomycetota bacterium]|nr:lipoyl synthase [Actinomycetota bacterium]
MSVEQVVPPGVKPLRLLDEERARRAGVARAGLGGRPGGRKPPWLKVTARQGENFRDLKRLMRDLTLNTVCEQAGCPNIYECWEDREATYLIGGEDCTRRCGFCQIRTGKPKDYDRDEPRRVAEAVAHLGLRYIVITGVARDDLDDGGAWLFAECIRQVRARVPGCGVEVLPSDFAMNLAALQQVTDEAPDVFAHNVETVERLYPLVRPGFRYRESLRFLAEARRLLPEGCATKSNIIVGMGETNDEVVEVMRDLSEVGVSLLTIGQYLQPSAQHLKLDRYVAPDEFSYFADVGRELGFDHVEAGPMVRSSYHAGRQARAAGAWDAEV